MSLLCAAPRCAVRGRHTDGCDGECRGCLVALAAPGLRLCDLHTARISTDALRCAELDRDVVAVLLAASDRPGERGGASTEHGTVINERAVDMRIELRHTLVGWARLIAEERGIALPPDRLDAIGAYLATHHVWLAAHPAAGDCADELSSLRRRAWNVAYPTGARVFPVGPCPTCGATVRVVLRAVDSLLPSELVCEADEPHRWPADAWRELGRRINRRYLSAAEIAEEWRLPLGSVYRHASQAHWRRSEDGRRPVLYLAEDVRVSLDRLTSAEARSS